MRAPLLLPISIALLAAFPALAQDAPRVLFCSGPCFAVDANGVRTSAPKGTALRPNQRFETGPGAYAQLKLGADAAMAVGDSARVRFDAVSLQDPMVVNLDLGRARFLLREGIGKPIRPIELNTADGRFVLTNADVEVKRTQLANAGNVTVMKVNAGSASLRSGGGLITVPTTSTQGIAAGKLVSQPIAVAELALTPPTRAGAQVPTSLPVAAMTLPTFRPLPQTVTAPLPGTIADAPLRPVLSRGELIPTQPIITPTGEVKTLTTYVLTDPLLTTSTTTRSLELIDTSTTLSTSSLSSISLTTTSTTTTDSTITKITTSPTLLTTTTTTTSTLTTSPTISTITSPILLQPLTIK